MGRVSENTLDGLLDIIETISRSPALKEYSLGLTNDVKRRTMQYRNWRYDSVVVLIGGLTCDQALDLEKRLHEEAAKDRRLKRKYRTRDDRHRRSLGGARSTRAPVYSIYMAWVEAT
jgi:hypothetical protein